MDAKLITVVNFSGGRSSAMMAKIIIDSYAPGSYIINFANTGKEHGATLEFVRDCEQHWGVPINWIEYMPEAPGFRIVTFETASRNGEPYAALISKKKFLPNALMRFCTSELKVIPLKKFVLSLGLVEWEQAIGIRYDEPKRYRRLPNSATNEPYEMLTPLYDMRVTKPDVLRFWRAQKFDLLTPPVFGNCDLCFLKGKRGIREGLRKEPDRAEWWAAQEHKTGGFFRAGIRYTTLRDQAASTPNLFDADDVPMLSCLCTID